MDQIEFARYHNKLIKFTYEPPRKVTESLMGVVLAIYPVSHSRKQTEYWFIPSNYLSEWKKADKLDDTKTKIKLSSIIDIRYITKASLVHHTFTPAAQIAFESLPVLQKKKLASVFNKLTETNIYKRSDLTRLNDETKYVLRQDDFRIFFQIDRFGNLLISNIINKHSINYIGK